MEIEQITWTPDGWREPPDGAGPGDVARVSLHAHPCSRHAGRALAGSLDPEGLRHVLVLSDGLRVNGSDLVQGLSERLPPDVAATGGLSADGSRFERTLVGVDGEVAEGMVAAVGFYGAALRVGYGSLVGWDPFGPERVITRSRGNVLYELDGCSALQLYRRYLGEHAAELPASGLLFPLSLRTAPGEAGVVRTILAVDEAEQSVTFAGDVPEGAMARLMKANFERLIDGATGAARTSGQGIRSGSAQLALLISCVGRKLILKQRTEEEVESVRDVLGRRAVLAGFYSYGEISPFSASTRCELHNQTMTVTTFAEDAG
ncbi:MAG: FIST C-terminal domain-containing protein [Gemmatimonadetes bacterium]|nr:FIST C-terminal domain-containing protein [Gemmatimonadota bacterium]